MFGRGDLFGYLLVALCGVGSGVLWLLLASGWLGYVVVNDVDMVFLWVCGCKISALSVNVCWCVCGAGVADYVAGWVLCGFVWLCLEFEALGLFGFRLG